MEAPALRPTRLHARVVDDIVGRIVSGELPSGSQLPSEPDMSAKYGVSRTVVREALRVLSSKGLVDVRHGSGTRVTPPDCWDPLDAAVLSAQLECGMTAPVLRDLVEARRIIETEVAALAALRHGPGDRRTLERTLERMRATTGDPGAFVGADAEFHDALFHASGNRILVRMMDPIHELVHFGQELTDAIPGVLQRALQDHEAIAEAVIRRDADGAREAMRGHLIRTERDITTLMEA